MAEFDCFYLSSEYWRKKEKTVNYTGDSNLLNIIIDRGSTLMFLWPFTGYVFNNEPCIKAFYVPKHFPWSSKFIGQLHRSRLPAQRTNILAQFFQPLLLYCDIIFVAFFNISVEPTNLEKIMPSYLTDLSMLEFIYCK